ncbi:TBC1 domain family member 22A isoform X5 [Callithrix jacchus]|uniref:TBC1 domain family member 22A isoform X2 n=1 Tax=Callithrix jacchus TaxID=9483 RepID=UPI0023DD3EA5|nr:TBC1 domain family member 22A isoform X2 [Callithrix jacchus]
MASDGARKQFWKRSNTKLPGSIQHVYGAQHPPFDPLLHGTLLKSTAKMPTTPLKAKRVSTFQEFESSTSDAWDAGEDDDELLAMAAESLNTEVVMETAHRVLRNHSQRQGRPALREAPGLQQKPRPEVESPSPPSGDLRLVKSVSESHTSCPAESACAATPLQRSQSLPHSATIMLGGTSDPSTLSSSALSEREASRLDKFKQLLAGPNTDLEELRRLSWSGIPKPVRPMTWKLLSIFERILFIWAIRHPASGYVQGINDLVTPFFVVFICEYLEAEEVDAVDVSGVPAEVLRNIEADTYWCMSKLLDGIQDNYTFAQPGIQMKVKMLEELVSRIDEQVHRHLDQHEVRYLQFAFRWMNNLLMREVPLRCTIRLWDTYQSEPEGFSHFHLYVCAAFLVRWRKEILEERDFQLLDVPVPCTAQLTRTLRTTEWFEEQREGALLARLGKDVFLTAKWKRYVNDGLGGSCCTLILVGGTWRWPGLSPTQAFSPLKPSVSKAASARDRCWYSLPALAFWVQGHREGQVGMYFPGCLELVRQGSGLD